MDEFKIHYDVKNPRRPVGVEYITPNNGPFHDLNPSYRIFYVDGDHPKTTRVRISTSNSFWFCIIFAK